MKLAFTITLFCAAAVAAAQDLVVFHNAAETPQAQLTAYLNTIGKTQLAEARIWGSRKRPEMGF